MYHTYTTSLRVIAKNIGAIDSFEEGGRDCKGAGILMTSTWRVSCISGAEWRMI